MTISQAALAQQDQNYYASPDEAVQALLQAVTAEDIDALLAIFGEQGRSVVISGDEQDDRAARDNFNTAAQQLNRLEAISDTQQELIVGEDEWPFPIPLVQEDQGWRFDTAAGAEEILNRRIGQNELEAIAMLQALADAQSDYANVDRDDDQVREFAQRIISSTGQQDGLFWPNDANTNATSEELSPIGPYLQSASDYAQGKQTGDPWHGYYFRVLTQQGPNPPGGAYDYVINGNMIAGFGLLAFPAQHGDSGVMTFIISHQGLMYQKDLGENTAELAQSMETYDPDDSWQPVDES
jgi:hypothetical protein